MALYINTTKVGSTAYMGSTKLNKIKFNGTEVWTGKPPYYDELKNGTVLSESQWIDFLNGGGVEAVINNNDKDSFIGKKFQLNNSLVSNYTTWIIIDFNHDDTSNTVDVLQQNIIISKTYDTSTYENSSIRSWLKNNYYPAFNQRVKNKTVSMAVTSRGASTTLNDFIKLPSQTEMGNYGSPYEGKIYAYLSNIDNRKKTGANSWSQWWLRTVFNGPQAVLVSSTGTYSVESGGSDGGLVPILRFS